MSDTHIAHCAISLAGTYLSMHRERDMLAFWRSLKSLTAYVHSLRAFSYVEQSAISSSATVDQSSRAVAKRGTRSSYTPSRPFTKRRPFFHPSDGPLETQLLRNPATTKAGKIIQKGFIFTHNRTLSVFIQNAALFGSNHLFKRVIVCQLCTVFNNTLLTLRLFILNRNLD